MYSTTHFDLDASVSWHRYSPISYHLLLRLKYRAQLSKLSRCPDYICLDSENDRYFPVLVVCDLSTSVLAVNILAPSRPVAASALESSNIALGDIS